MLEKTAKISKYFLENLGQRAARSYLDSNTELNNSVEKLAVEHGLNNECIKRVCEFANTNVEGELFNTFQKTAREKDKQELYYPVFKQATASVIIKSLRRSEKTAAASIYIDDYDRPIPTELGVAYDKNIYSEFEKAAFYSEPSLANFDLALEKLGMLRTECLFNKAASELNIDDHACKAYQHIKDQVLKGSDIKQLYKACLNKQSELENKLRVKDLFQYAASKLVDEGVIITQDRQAVKLAYAPLNEEEREEIISDMFELPEGAGCMQMLNGSYVNDEHPLFCELDILIKQYDEADRYDKALTVIDDRIKYVKRKLNGESLGGA